MSIKSENDHSGGSFFDREVVDAKPEKGPGDRVDRDAPLVLTAEEEKQLWNKVDWQLMPILSVMYLLSFMDRGNIGNAKIEGLMKELNLTGNRYNIAVTMFFVSYSALECPSNLVLKVIRPSRWLPGIMVVWGIVMMSMGFVKTYQELIAVRFCLGIAEAGLVPGILYYLTLWYPRHMLQYRVALFFGATTAAGAFSGLLAFAIGFMDGMGHLEGWSWIFILEGLLTVVVAFIAYFVIVDSPSTASFLTTEERAYLIWRKKYDNSSVGEEERFAFRHLVAPFTDWQVYLHILVTISLAAPVYGITFFLSSIIKSFGYTTAVSQLLTVPPYVTATLVLLIWAHYSDKLQIRSAFIYAGLLLLLIGFSINISDAPNGVKYFGTFLIIIGGYAGVPGMFTWLGNNLVGQYKRAIGIAFQIGMGNLGGAIAVNMYRLQDAPRYRLGYGLELMFVGIGLIAVPILVILYKRINRARDEAERLRIEQGEKIQLTVEELRDLGDRAPDFRYML